MRQKNNVRYERRSGLNNIVKSAKRELARLEAMKKEIDDFFICAPLGCLKWQKKFNRKIPQELWYTNFG